MTLTNSRANWVDDPELESVITLLSDRTRGLPDAHDAGTGRLITCGVGSNANEAYVNDTFALRDYCWCEGGLHPEAVDWDNEDSPYSSMPPSGGTSSGCPLNFEHFASGIQGQWYKHLGRSVEFNRVAGEGEALAVLTDCLISIPGSDTAALLGSQAQHRVWGWSK